MRWGEFPVTLDCYCPFFIPSLSFLHLPWFFHFCVASSLSPFACLSSDKHINATAHTTGERERTVNSSSECERSPPLDESFRERKRARRFFNSLPLPVHLTQRVRVMLSPLLLSCTSFFHVSWNEIFLFSCRREGPVLWVRLQRGE